MRLSPALATALLAAALLAGCGGSSDDGGGGSTSSPAPRAGGSGAPAGASARSCETMAIDAKALRATGLSCGEARRLLYGWQRNRDCAVAPGASRAACSTRRYRCAAAKTARGLAVSCSRPGRSIAFVAKRG